MARIIRRTVKKRGTALIVAVQLTFLTLLSLVSFVNGPQQSAPPKDGFAVANGSQVNVAQAQTQTAQAQAETDEPRTAKDLTAADKAALRKSAHFAKKLYEPLNTQMFNLATQRAAAAHNSELPNSATLTTDRQDYPPYSYVYFHGSGFQPGETVDMLVVETDPVQQSFDPWSVVADANGEFDTSWFVFSSDFEGASFLATATGETSQLTASATFTDANGAGNMQV